MSPPEHNLPPLPPTDNRPLWDIWLSGFRLPALTVADELGIFQRLRETPSTANELANDLGLSERSAEALLNMLTAMGFLARHNKKFHITDLSGSYLLPDSPHYWGGVLHTVKDNPVSHSMIMDAIRGDAAHPARGSGRRFTDMWKDSTLAPEQARSFTAKMHSHGFASAIALARSPCVENINRLLDVGGGSGCYSISLAATHPDMTCVVMDLETVCHHTREYIKTYRLSDRIEVLPLDMFRDSWPTGFDAIFMSDIVHDWNRDMCLALARKALDSLIPGGRIILNEVLLDDDACGPVTGNAYSLAMLMVTEGKQFTGPELVTLLDEAGFSNIDISSGYGYYSLITGHKY